MPQSALGIDPTRVDTARQYQIGWEIGDPRANDFPGNTIKYIKAGSAISAGNALVVSLADAEEPYTLVPCSAVNQVIAGIAHVAIASGSFGWVTKGGRHPGVTNTGTITAGNKLTTSATAGALTPLADADSNVTSTKLNAALAMAAGIGVLALDSNDSNAALMECLLT